MVDTLGTDSAAKDRTLGKSRSILDTRIAKTPLSVNSPLSNTHQLTRLRSERPTSTTNQQSKHVQQVKSSPFDFVCTSEACFRIKKKMAAVGFSKTGNSSNHPMQAIAN